MDLYFKWPWKKHQSKNMGGSVCGWEGGWMLNKMRTSIIKTTPEIKNKAINIMWYGSWLIAIKGQQLGWEPSSVKKLGGSNMYHVPLISRLVTQVHPQAEKEQGCVCCPVHWWLHRPGHWRKQTLALVKCMIPHGTATSSGEDSAIHLHLKVKGHSLKDSTLKGLVTENWCLKEG